MSKSGLRGVIAAAATPITGDYQPDLPRFVALCRRLLDNGCDGLNICGTTGEATSFTVAQRMAIMDAAAAVLPLDRLMVGTGAASIGDAIALTKHAAELGFAGGARAPALLLQERRRRRDRRSLRAARRSDGGSPDPDLTSTTSLPSPASSTRRLSFSGCAKNSAAASPG